MVKALCNELEVRRPEFMAALHQQHPRMLEIQLRKWGGGTTTLSSQFHAREPRESQVVELAVFFCDCKLLL